MPGHREHVQRRPRAQYASRACNECRRRKVKCSGVEPCQCCIAADLTCRYNLDRQRSRRSQEPYDGNHSKSSRRSRPDDSAVMRRPYESQSTKSPEPGTSVPASTHHLKQTWSQQPRDHPNLSSDPRSAIMAPEVMAVSTVAENWFGPGHSLLPAQKKALKTISAGNSPDDEAAAKTNQNDDTSRKLGNQGRPSIPCRLANTPRLAFLLRQFLTEQNFCFHCVDPDDFVARLSSLLESHSQDTPGHVQIPPDRPELISLAALACMVLAHAEYLAEGSQTSNREGGEPDTHTVWYVEAQRLRDLYARNIPVNMDFVRFYLLEAFYCLGRDCVAQDTVNDAPRAMSMAVTSAYSAGLNNEARWGDLSQEEKTSRRCLWITVYWMDRQVAYKSGRPYLISDNEVAVSDLANDIERTTSRMVGEANSGAYNSKEIGGAANPSPYNAAVDPSPFSADTRFKLLYLQSLVGISQMFTRAWGSFFSVRGYPAGREKEDVHAVDALFVKAQRGLPPELSWNASDFSVNQKAGEPASYLKVRLLLLTRTNVLRLAIYHASVRGRKGDPALTTRYPLAEYKHTLSYCDEICYVTVTALVSYLDTLVIDSCLTTYVASALLECIYHLVAIAQHAVLYEASPFRLSSRMISTMTFAVQALRKTASNIPNPRQQLARDVLSLIQGVLDQQSRSTRPPIVHNTPQPHTGNVDNATSSSSVMPTLRDQIIYGVSDDPSASQHMFAAQDHDGNQAINADTNNDAFQYFFDPNLLPGYFADSSGMIDFLDHQIFSTDMSCG